MTSFKDKYPARKDPSATKTELEALEKLTWVQYLRKSETSVPRGIWIDKFVNQNGMRRTNFPVAFGSCRHIIDQETKSQIISYSTQKTSEVV